GERGGWRDLDEERWRKVDEERSMDGEFWMARGAYREINGGSWIID
ncbi:hypothetical protein L195_g063220, partial [Trifolium pratense]